ncbi:MAG TPA: hypothetical protein VLG11_00030 [Candidatus Saccharimonadales bacterium]|nr:hypothetical protein [Candidatus Saccharimonadales bacterium]
MKQPFGEAAGALTPDHIAALNAVDLQVYTGVHGTSVEDIPLHGPAVVGVTDLEYAGMDRVVDALESERGDVLAIEAMGWIVPDAVPRAAEKLVDAMQRSRHVWRPLREAFEPIAADSLPPEDVIEYGVGAAVRRDTVEAGLPVARQLRLIDPLTYGVLRAEQKGVDALHADLRWSEDLTPPKNDDILAQFEYLERSGNANRHLAIAATLGNIAATMPAAAEKPVLAYNVGVMHEAPLKQLFHEHGVRATFGRFGPSRFGESLRNTWRDTAAFLLDGAVQPSDEVLKSEWIANAKAVEAQRRQQGR